jgi:hypothetical protein
MTASPDIIRVPLRVGGEPTEPADGRYFDKLCRLTGQWPCVKFRHAGVNASLGGRLSG